MRSCHGIVQKRCTLTGGRDEARSDSRVDSGAWLVAANMSMQPTTVIGLIVPDMTHAFMTQVIQGVNRGVNELGFDLIVCTTSRDRRNVAELAEWEQQQVALINGGIATGTIVVVPSSHQFQTNAPLVAVDPHNDAVDFPAVISTNRIGVMEAIAYLVRLGHRRIGFIRGRNDLQSAERRRLGYIDGLNNAQIPIDPELIRDGDFTYEAGYLGALDLLAHPNRPTAIMAANDESALGVIDAARERHLTVPGDLSVVGFDNIPDAQLVDPPLTTVDQSGTEMGRIAVTMMATLLQDQALPSPIHKINTRFVVRQSCTAPSSFF